MADYLHGAYGVTQAEGIRVIDDSQSTIVYVGTAPVHQILGGAANVNKPIVINNIAEAYKYFGYSENWASYTLCEAVYAHFTLGGVGPLVLINVFDPSTMKSTSQVTKSLTAKGGKITITGGEAVILDTITIEEKTLGTDFTAEYDINRKRVILTELKSGAFGTSAVEVKYYTALPSSVAAANVIGTSDGLGANTGMFCIQDVYQVTGMIPAYIAAPGFSSDPTVHAAMVANSTKIEGHWDAYMFVDLPLTANSTALTLATAATWKSANGYEEENETVYFPMAKGIDGRKYHLSVLAASNFQVLLNDQDGVPYRTASNTSAAIISSLYTADDDTRVYNDQMINEYLNKNGIASAAYVGGRWAIWGAHSADYNPENANTVNVAETNRMMLYYISNDFQSRRTFDVDQPLSQNDLNTIVAEEQARLDALIKIGALIYGEVYLNATADTRSDMINGDYSFTFNVTTTPLAKSLTAIVNWTAEGFNTYFESAGD